MTRRALPPPVSTAPLHQSKATAAAHVKQEAIGKDDDAESAFRCRLDSNGQSCSPGSSSFGSADDASSSSPLSRKCSKSSSSNASSLPPSSASSSEFARGHYGGNGGGYNVHFAAGTQFTQTTGSGAPSTTSTGYTNIGNATSWSGGGGAFFRPNNEEKSFRGRKIGVEMRRSLKFDSQLLSGGLKRIAFVSSVKLFYRQNPRIHV